MEDTHRSRIQIHGRAEATIVGVELWQMLRKGQTKDTGEMAQREQLYSLTA